MGVTALPKVEVLTYIVVWAFGLTYSMFNTYLSSQKFCLENPTSCSLQPGWFLERSVDRPRDWETWSHFIAVTLSPWWLIHLIGAEITRRHFHQYLPMWYILIGSVFHTTVFGLASTAYLVFFTTAFLVLQNFRSKLLLWAVGCVALHNTYYLVKAWSEMFGWPLYHNLGVFGAMLGWTVLRCIAYCSEKIDSNNKEITTQHLIDYFSYIFYLPIMYGGPLINYDTFKRGMSVPYKPWTLSRLGLSCLSLLRCVFWMIVTDVALHFNYFNSMQKSIHTVLAQDNWALYGHVWCLGFYFMMTYVVSYGLSSAVANIEQMPVAEKPACVGRISLYSNMWRYFDRGLYLFMIKYIYLPCIGNHKGFLWRLLGSTATFIFIYIYHGVVDYVLVWTVVNFLEVTLEGIGKAVSSTSMYQGLESRYMSPPGARRFHALLASPLMAVSALSNMYFIGNSMALGTAFKTRLLTDGWQVQLMVLGFCYCASQAALEYQRCQESRHVARTDTQTQAQTKTQQTNKQRKVKGS